MRSMSINERINNLTIEPFIIAELGINHNGSFELAKKLIEGANYAGAHGIKFQYRNLKNAYSIGSNEIGDEILRYEIRKNFLTPNEINELTVYAKTLNLKVGISFFTKLDVFDFIEQINQFDFFKIPSVELMNFELVSYLDKFSVPLFISTGAHFEFEIEQSLKVYESMNWYPLHCVSNYPVLPHNSNFAYIKTLCEKYKRPAGLSSHERYWESILISLKYGPRVIERHISLNTNELGLDQTASSNLVEFARMVELISGYFTDTGYVDDQRVPNQGELINRQNLGRSFYAEKKLSAGTTLKLNDLSYRAPNIGLSYLPATLKNKKLIRDVESGSAITESCFLPEVELTEKELAFAHESNLAIPTRLYDFKKITTTIPTKKIELHLSYGDIKYINNSELDFQNYELTVHLPDYISSLELIDPYSPNPEIVEKSIRIIDAVSKFVSMEQNKSGLKIEIVGSFSNVGSQDSQLYYEKYIELISNLRKKDIFLNLQWLPPFAWYFGGSQKINIMNSIDDIYFIKKYNIPVCLDISHLILGANHFGFLAENLLKEIEQQVSFFHISDSIGVDGEGIQFDSKNSPNNRIFRTTLTSRKRKTIEVWQGHLENAKGFKLAIKELYKILGMNNE